MRIKFFRKNIKLQWIKFLDARSGVPLAQICACVLVVSTVLGLRAWGDDLNVLFEFLDDTKLAQSCTDWLGSTCSTGTPSSGTLQCA